MLEPIGVVDLQGRSPACVIRGQIHKEESVFGVHRVNELTELVERRRVGIKLRHSGVDGHKVKRGKRTSHLAHHRIGRGHWEGRQSLNASKAEGVHYMGQATDHFTERPKLPWEDGVD